MTFSDKEKIDLAKKEVYVNKDPDKALQIIEPFEENGTKEVLELFAYAFFLKGEYKRAAVFYKKAEMLYQQGYCLLMSGDNASAKKIWSKLDKSSALSWGLCLVDYVEQKVSKIPTYLQIRNYLEKDLSNLLKAGQKELAQNLISCSETLVNINPESYKIIAKALFNQGYKDASVEYWAKSQEITNQDPEIYFYLAKYCFEKNAVLEAKAMLNNALDINELYLPAKKMLDEIS